MNAQNVEEILAALAANFGTTVEHLWAVMLRQVWVEFYLGLAFVVVGFIAGALAVWFGPRMENDDASIIIFVLATALVAAACIALFTIVGYPFNPEYYALLKIMGAF